MESVYPFNIVERKRKSFLAESRSKDGWNSDESIIFGTKIALLDHSYASFDAMNGLQFFEEVKAMTLFAPIQPDFDGLYYDIPDTLSWNRKQKRPLHLIEDMEKMKRELLERAKKGEEEAIQTLKEKYRLTCYIYKGKKII